MKTKILRLSVISIIVSFSSIVSSKAVVILDNKIQDPITIQKPALYPETIVYNSISDKFLVGSFREGAIYEVDVNGEYRKFIDNKRLKSALGISIDIARDRLLVVTSDIGSSIRSYSKGPKKLASVAFFELSSGKFIRSVDLGGLILDGDHLANGITVDTIGNIYVTDSFSPVIYKIDTKGQPSIFLESDKFKGDGINLNGIVFHPDGYLLTVKKSDGVLFKVPVDNPEGFSEIQSQRKFIGGDGLILVNENDLIVVANRASGITTETVFSITTNDGWKSAKVIDEIKFGDVYLTTGAIRKDKIYVIHSNINALVQAPHEQKAKLKHFAKIHQVGSVQH